MATVILAARPPGRRPITPAALSIVSARGQCVRFYLAGGAPDDVAAVTVIHAEEFDEPSAYYVGQASLPGMRETREHLPTTRPADLPLAEAMPRWTVYPAKLPEMDRAVSVSTMCRGWPLPALRSVTYEFKRYDNGGMQPIDARTVGQVQTPFGPQPLLPVWPGFVVNTLLFAAPWVFALLVMYAAGAARRRYRRRRGRCIACGYDLRGLSGAVCPECGSPPR